MDNILNGALPFLPAIVTAVIGLIVLYLIHRLLLESVMESLARFLNEVNSAAERRKEPTAINFYFGLALVFIFVSTELVSAARELLVRPSDDPWTLWVVFLFVLVLFFLGSLAIGAEYESTRKNR
jgi:hypothetical protein